jgi:hypothetical protein
MNPSINNTVPGKAARKKTTLITLVIVFAVLLWNVPLLHMLDTSRRLHNVALPLSNQQASMNSDGLGPSGTNISFTVTKNYASPVEAKNDILKQLEAQGISILQPTDKPSSISLKYNGTSGKELPINEIATTFYPRHFAFTFYLAQPMPCEPDAIPNNDEYLCEGEVRNNALKNKLFNSRPVRSVNVQAAVGLWH